MAIDNINNNSSALLNDIYNTKTNTNDKTNNKEGLDKIASNPAAGNNAAKSDNFSSGTLSKFNSLNSGYLNYSANGSYANPSLADFLSSGSNNPDDFNTLQDGSPQNSSDDTDLTSYLNGVDSSGSDEQESQLEATFSSFADQMAARDTQLINNAIARLSQKFNK